MLMCPLSILHLLDHKLEIKALGDEVFLSVSRSGISSGSGGKALNTYEDIENKVPTNQSLILGHTKARTVRVKKFTRDLLLVLHTSFE